MNKALLAVPALCAALLSSAARADTVYTSASAFAAATQDPALVDFGTTPFTFGYTSVTVPGAPVSVGPVIISSSGSFVNANNDNYYTNNGGFPTYPDGNYIETFGGASNDDITFSFSPTGAFSINLGGTFGPGETFTYTLSDGTTGTYTASGFVTSGNPLDFLGFTASGAPLTSVTFLSTNATDNAAYDNVVLAHTPEPSSLMLLGTGLAGVFGSARRKLKRG